MVDEFGLVETDLRLREGVVVRVADGADGRVDALVDEPVGEGNRGVDAACVGVVRESGEPGDAFAAAGEQGHVEAVEHERSCHPGRRSPPDDAAGVRVEHERDVDPSGPRPDVGEVGDPELVRAEPREVPVDEVGGPGLPQIRIHGTFPLPADHSGDPELAHEAFDRATGNVVPVATHPQPELPGPEHFPMRLPRGQDDRLPPLVRHDPR